MSTQIQFRRGTTADHATFTGAVGELTVDSDKDVVVVHDGVLAGGHPLVKEADLGTIASQNANNVSITGGSITGISTLVEQDSATGAAQLPSGTTAQRPAGVAGEIRYNSQSNSFEGYNGVTGWSGIGGGAAGGGADQIFYLNDQLVTTNYTIPTGKNALSAGPIQLDTGVVVTVAPPSVWTIV